MRELRGKIGLAVLIWGVMTSLFQLYTAGFGLLEPRLQRCIHLTFLLPLSFLLFPATRRSPKDRVTLPDLILAFLSLLPGLMVIWESDRLTERWEHITPVLQREIVLGTLQIVLLLEATRRSVAPALAFLTGLFIVYLFIGSFLPGVLHAEEFRYDQIIELLFLLADEGIYGIITGVSATFAYCFVLFGALILVAGTGDFFTGIAKSLTGRMNGGPAKVAVISSALFGMVSGVGVSNVYATGSFTIPLMKSIGYRPQFAGAVEACASSGGQYMPPIMGAAAFIMAEIIGIPYATIALSAFLSAVIYYVGVYSVVHFEAQKEGLRGLPQDQIPSLKKAMRKGYLILPVVGIVYLLVSGYSAIMAAFYACLLAVISSYLGKETRMKLDALLKALSSGANNSIMLAVSCAASGIIVSVVTHTGLGITFTSAVVSLSQGILIIALILVMAASLILGMGLPSTAAYILVAALTAPALVRMGVDILAAHLFAFYFANISCITPPVGVCFYAGASIAGADPMKTGWEATKLGISGYIVPFMFVYAPALVLRPLSWMTAWMFFIAFVGAVVASTGVSGWFLGHRIPWWERILLVVSAVTLIFPTVDSTIYAAVVLMLYYFFKKWQFKRGESIH
jgi:TRAP transporter 4TM/12TM fusion protein